MGTPRRNPVTNEAVQALPTETRHDNHWCDRRLSRAARHLVDQFLRDAHLGDNSLVSLSAWDLLDQSLLHSRHHSTDTESSCPLLHDALRTQEAGVTEVPALQFSRRGPKVVPRSGNYNPSWLQCGLCGKVFVSRYYLDRHFDERHPLSDDHDAECPAIAWCQSLGLSHCADRAQKLEGDYGPGAADLTVRKRIQRQWAAHTERCYDVGPACRTLADACFGGSDESSVSLHTHWTTIVCPRLSCHDRLQRLLVSDKWLGSYSDSESGGVWSLGLMAGLWLFIWGLLVGCGVVQPSTTLRRHNSEKAKLH